MSKKVLNKPSSQKGGANTIMIMIILGVVVYGFYHFTAERKSTVISYVGKYKNIKENIKNEINRRSATNRNFKGFGVQVVATQNFPKAKQLMNDFYDDGYSAFILSSKDQGRTLYKVRLGPYEDKSAAGLVQGKIKRRYAENRNLKTSFIVYRP